MAALVVIVDAAVVVATVVVIAIFCCCYCCSSFLGSSQPQCEVLIISATAFYSADLSILYYKSYKLNSD